MPARSQAQRRWAYGVKGKAWARRHHFNNKGKLPARIRKKKTKAKRRRSRGRKKR